MLCFYNENEQAFLNTVNAERCKNNPLLISDLDIRGEDVMPLCNKDYSKVGKILEALLHKVIEDPTLNEKEKLIEIAKKELL